LNLFKLLIIAATLEALWETCKMFWQSGKANIDRIGAAIIGIFLCLAAGIDFFNLVEVPLALPYAGAVLSGLLISRGANFIHDLLGAVQGFKDSNG
jgi:hypothetical protein